MRFLLILLICLTTTSLYGQYPFYTGYQFNGFITNWNPSSFYYPDYMIGPPDFQPIEDTLDNRNEYPEIFNLQKTQQENQLKANRLFPELNRYRPKINNRINKY